MAFRTWLVVSAKHTAAVQSQSAVPAPQLVPVPAEFLLFNAKFLVFNASFLVFNTQFLVFDTKFIISTHLGSVALLCDAQPGTTKDNKRQQKRPLRTIPRGI